MRRVRFIDTGWKCRVTQGQELTTKTWQHDAQDDVRDNARVKHRITHRGNTDGPVTNSRKHTINTYREIRKLHTRRDTAEPNWHFFNFFSVWFHIYYILLGNKYNFFLIQLKWYIKHIIINNILVLQSEWFWTILLQWWQEQNISYLFLLYFLKICESITAHI